MAIKNASDRRCLNGKGGPQADDRLGNLDDLLAAEATAAKPLHSENQKAVGQGVKIRLGLPANE